jgi:monoamine oxidase
MNVIALGVHVVDVMVRRRLADDRAADRGPARLSRRAKHALPQARSGLGRVTVDSDKVTVKAKRAIVAVPPGARRRIDYEPLLPFQRDRLTQRYGQGTLSKVAAVYNRPFWRDAGLTGQAVDTGGPVSATFDDSPPTASSSRGPGIIFGFVGGGLADARSGSPPPARCSSTGRGCACRSGGSTGPARRHPTTGTATWTAPSAPASVPRARS